MSDLNENSKVFCPKCGWGNTSEAKFCMNCGEGLAKAPENNMYNEPPNAPQPSSADSADNSTAYSTAASTANSKIEAEEVASTPWQDSVSNPYYSTGPANMDYNTSSPYYVQEAPEEVNKSSGLSIASLVCGISALVCCILTIPLSITSIVLGIISLSKKNPGKGMAIGGIVTSAVSILFYLFIFVISFVIDSGNYYY